MPKPEDRKPKYYTGLEQFIIANGYTPVLIVLGGSCITEAYHDESDVDISVYVSDDMEESFRLDVSEMKSVMSLDTTLDVRIKIYPLKWADRITFVETYRDVYYPIYIIEDVVAYPPIYETSGIDEFRAKCAAFPRKDLGEKYMQKSKEYESGKSRDHNRVLSLRLALTGAYLLAKGEWELDIRKLCKWAKIRIDWNAFKAPTGDVLRLRPDDHWLTEIHHAQDLLQSELDKLKTG